MVNQSKVLPGICSRTQTTGSTERIVCLFLAFSLGLTFLYSSISQAQMQSIKEGDRVRIYAPTVSKRAVTGMIDSISPSAIAVMTKKSTVVIPNTSISRLSVSRGKKRNIGKGIGIGAVSGGLILGITTLATNPPPDQCGSDSELFCGTFEISDGEAFTIGAVLGVLAGGAIGAIVGAATQTDRWEKIPVKVSIEMAPSYTDLFKVNPTVSFRLSLR